MSNTEDLRNFVHIVRSGNISNAAAQLDVPKSKLSRSLKRLEERLGCGLFIRNTRAMHLTQDGVSLYRDIAPALQTLEASLEKLASQSSGPAGLLRVSIPLAFGREVLIPELPHFRERFPKVQLDIRLAPQGTNPVRDGIDLSIEVGELNSSALIAQRFMTVEQWLVCHPKFDHSRPYSSLWMDRRHRPTLSLMTDLSEQRLAIDPNWHEAQIVDDPLSIRELIAKKATQDIALIPDFYAKPWISDGRLQRISTDINLPTQTPLYFVSNRVSLSQPKSQAFIEFAKECVSNYQG
jgi:DNA-binding transcriptional LysR family regulator